MSKAMQAPQQPLQVQQLTLLPDDQEQQSDEVQVLQEARAMYWSSRYLRSQFPTFEALMAQPHSGRALLIGARVLVRRRKRTRGR